MRKLIEPLDTVSESDGQFLWRPVVRERAAWSGKDITHLRGTYLLAFNKVL